MTARAYMYLFPNRKSIHYEIHYYTISVFREL